MTENGNWHKCDKPFFPRRTLNGTWTLWPGQTWRRWNGTRWEYWKDELTEEEWSDQF